MIVKSTDTKVGVGKLGIRHRRRYLANALTSELDELSGGYADQHTCKSK